MTKWMTEKCKEQKRIRIKLAMVAYSFQIGEPVMCWGEYKKLCNKFEKYLVTDNTKLDSFFREKFVSSGTSWVLDHPELLKIRDLHKRLKEKEISNGENNKKAS